MAAGETYEEFVEKFKPKHTTDDCMTPEPIYAVVRDWACAEYRIDPARIVRPFWPGGDYQSFDYPQGCTVLDNPPFSILSQIIRWYEEKGIRYFLFAPSLTCFNIHSSSTIVCGAAVTYENGAKVNTSFVTNLDTCVARTAPNLRSAIELANEEITHSGKATLPKYSYPPNVLTAAMLQYLSRYGIDYRVKRADATFIRSLDSQRARGKAIFGGGSSHKRGGSSREGSSGEGSSGEGSSEEGSSGEGRSYCLGTV